MVLTRENKGMSQGFSFESGEHRQAERLMPVSSEIFWYRKETDLPVPSLCARDSYLHFLLLFNSSGEDGLLSLNLPTPDVLQNAC